MNMKVVWNVGKNGSRVNFDALSAIIVISLDVNFKNETIFNLTTKVRATNMTRYVFKLKLSKQRGNILLLVLLLGPYVILKIKLKFFRRESVELSNLVQISNKILKVAIAIYPLSPQKR